MSESADLCMTFYFSFNLMPSNYAHAVFQDYYNDDTKLLHYLIRVLLPVIKKVNLDQIIELDIESRIKGTDNHPDFN